MDDVLLKVPLPEVMLQVPDVVPPVMLAPVKVIAEGDDDWHTVFGPPATTVTEGLMVILKLTGVPGQVAEGVPPV